MNKINNQSGFSLIEILVAMGLFVIISYGVFLAFGNVLEVSVRNQARIDGISVIQTELEIVRGMDFGDVGILNGSPPGKLSAQKTVAFGGNNFLVKTTVRNIDDPFDGTAGGNPNDTAPADYKLVEVEASCQTCINSNFIPFSMTATVSPKGLESASNNGSLFINIFDASGAPISNANISVINNALNPAITISDTTNANGVLQLVDIPTSTAAYEVSISKAGYSSDKTYPIGGINNPNPVMPHATVAKQQVTSISFAIDRVSSINLTVADKLCSPVSDFDFLLEGTKLIGGNPDVLKYSAALITNSSGEKTISNLEWDTYKFTGQDNSYDIIGTMPLLPLVLNPNTSFNLKAVLAPKNSLGFLTTVLDENGQPMADASVNLTKTGYDETKLTGRNFVSYTDWSAINYSSQSGEVETENPTGSLGIKSNEGQHSTTTEWLVSNTVDFGTSNITFYELNWNPQNQPPQTGADSLKFQIASNNDDSTWNFNGPDGTENTFYTISGAQINSIHNNNRYARYKIFLTTENADYTPLLNDITINFSSGCIPPGQVFFEGLASGTYNLDASKSGYQTFTDNGVSVSSDWKEYRVNMVKL